VALIGEARRRGVHFLSEARARLGPLLSDRRIVGVVSGGETLEFGARSVVAADGLGSGLMTQAGEPSTVPSSSKRRLVGLGGVFSAPGNDFEEGVIHMAVGEVGYVGLVRVEDGGLNLAAALDPNALRRAGSPQEVLGSLLSAGGWPPLPERPAEGWKGTPELTRRPGRPGAERLFAVGDAGGYVEPFTGEGVFWSLLGARLLAPIVGRVSHAWEPNLLEEWAGTHRRLLGRAQRLCRVVSWVLARPAISRSLIGMLRGFPRMAGPFVRRVGAPVHSIS
jgi:flavin-dependent dehydrogenase